VSEGGSYRQAHCSSREGLAEPETEEPAVLVSAADRLIRNVGKSPVCLGQVTNKVLFITDRDVMAAAGGRADGTFDAPPKGWKPSPHNLPAGVFVKGWKKGTEFSFECPPVGMGAPYRMVLVIINMSGAIVPMQQCVQWRFEEENDVLPGAWDRSGAALDSFKHWSRVQRLLTVGWEKNPTVLESSTVTAPESFVKAARSLLAGTLEVSNCTLAHSKGQVGADWAMMGKHNPETLVLALTWLDGHWVVSSFRSKRGEALGLASGCWHWLIEGKLPAGDFRRVVHFVSDKWLVYDKYGRLTGNQRELRSAGLTLATEGDLAEHSLAVVHDVDLSEIRLEAERWYDKQAAKRDALAEDARVEAGESGFTLGESLRVTWLLAQRADPELAALLKHASGVPDSRGFRRGDDGLLEKQIVHKAPFPPTFVPVVPKGFAAANMSWRRWMFLQVHIGIFGGHRNEEKTRELLSRLAYWEDSVRDVKEWTERCITCIRFRKRPNKNEMVAVKPMRQEAWEEIMVDCEGPSNPPDLQGNIYVLTYLCLLCHGVLLEPGVNLTHLQLRRMFCRCVFRAGTLPTVLRAIADRNSRICSWLNLLLSSASARSSGRSGDRSSKRP
jgi:hypothetical protein